MNDVLPVRFLRQFVTKCNYGSKSDKRILTPVITRLLFCIFSTVTCVFPGLFPALPGVMLTAR